MPPEATRVAGRRRRRRYLNCYYDRNHLVFVSRDAEGEVVRERVKARTTCFFKAADLTPELVRMLRDDDDVAELSREGDWYRAVWKRPQFAREAYAGFHSRGITTYEGTVSAVRRYVADHRLRIATPRRVFLDIETDSRVPIARAVEGKARLLCYALVDQEGNEVTDVLSADDDASEARLFERLWERLSEYDQVCAWAGDHFDFSVLRERSKVLGVRSDHRRLLLLDHLVCFEKMNRMGAKSGDEKQSMKLQDIGMRVAGEGKTEFDASRTWHEWEAGGARRRKLVEYCLQDTRLLLRIEERTGFIELLQTLCEVTGAFPDSRGCNSNNQVENYLLRIGVQRGIHFPTRLDVATQGRWVQDDPFRGAFVMEPTVRGVARDVHVADFERLYPSIIQTFNMSPETKSRGPEVMTRAQPAGMFDCTSFVHEVSGRRRAEVSRECEAPTGTRFFNEPDGILAVALRKILKLREKWKKKMKEVPPGTPEWHDANRRSTAYKSIANSFYGVIGSTFARFYDRDVAEAVTQVGQWLIRETITAASSRGYDVIYGDTDSIFVRGVSEGEFVEFVAWCNKELYPKLLASRGCTRNYIRLGYEKAHAVIVMLKAKRYAARYLHYEGKRCTSESAPEIKGLEFRRGDSVKLARDFQEEVVHRVLGYKCEECTDDPTVLAAIVERWKRYVMTTDFTLEQVMVAKQLTMPIDEYKRKRKKDGEWARRPPHVEIAAELARRGRDVIVGARVDYFCLDGSTKPKTFAPGEDWEGKFDRHTLWEDFVWPPTYRFLDAAFPHHDWKQWSKTRPRLPRRRKDRASELEKAGQARLPEVD